jgi:hypothetical protein
MKQVENLLFLLFFFPLCRFQFQTSSTWTIIQQEIFAYSNSNKNFIQPEPDFLMLIFSWVKFKFKSLWEKQHNWTPEGIFLASRVTMQCGSKWLLLSFSRVIYQPSISYCCIITNRLIIESQLVDSDQKPSFSSLRLGAKISFSTPRNIFL